MQKTALMLTLIAFFLWQAPLSAQSSSLEERWIERNRQISKYFDGLARELDYQLSGRRIDDSNESRFSIIGFVEASEVMGVMPDAHVDLDLKLPAFEESIKLQLSSFDAEDEFEGLDRNRTNARPQEQKLGTSLAIGQKFSNVQVTFRPRVELRDPLLTSFLFKISHELQLGAFVLTTKARALTHSRDGFAQSVTLNLERPLSETTLIRLFNEQQYLDQFNLFRVAQGLLLLHKATEHVSVSHTVSFNSQNRSFLGMDLTREARSYTGYHINSYQYIFSLHHQLYPNVFHYQVSPSMNFYKDRSFQADPAIMLRTELIF